MHAEFERPLKRRPSKCLLYARMNHYGYMDISKSARLCEDIHLSGVEDVDILIPMAKADFAF